MNDTHFCAAAERFCRPVLPPRALRSDIEALRDTHVFDKLFWKLGQFIFTEVGQKMNYLQTSHRDCTQLMFHLVRTKRLPLSLR